MKKLITPVATLVFFLGFAIVAEATPVSWDAVGTSLQPLSAMRTYVVKGSSFTATSTTASVFPYASSTVASATRYCLTGDTCISSWPSGTTSVFPFTPNSWGNSTTTTIGFTQGIIADASSTFSYLTSGLVGNNSGKLYSFATSSLGVALSDTSGTLTVARGGSGQTSFTSGQLLYGNGTNALSSVATSSASNGTGITLSGTGALVGSGGLTITNTGVISLSCTTITCSGTNPASLSIGNGAIANAQLANSTISGVALGGTLAALSHDTTLSGTSYTGTSAVSDWGLNLAHGNTFTALQQFNGNASTTGLTNSGTEWLTSLGTSAGAFLAVDGSGKVISTTTPGLTVGTSVVNNATNGYILYNNNGVLGVKSYNGGGNVVLDTSPSIFSPTFTFTNFHNDLTFGGTASAVNYLTINNNDTGLAASIQANSSSDTNSSINLIPRGTGGIGIATTTPWALLSVNPSGILGPAFAIGSSTATKFAVGNMGQVDEAATEAATSSTITLDWGLNPQQVEYQLGSGATTINVINATTTQHWGSVKRVMVCNPHGFAAGALSWVGVEWFGGTAPTQTTTADQCDLYSFGITRATSTTAYKVMGAASTGFQ
jgi:hypothetical protein